MLHPYLHMFTPKQLHIGQVNHFVGQQMLNNENNFPKRHLTQFLESFLEVESDALFDEKQFSVLFKGTCVYIVVTHRSMQL